MQKLFLRTVAGSVLWVAAACSTALPAEPPSAQFEKAQAVVHLHSTVSCGVYSMDELCDLARRDGIEILIITDHDQRVVEYGVPFLHRLFKQRKQDRSIFSYGIDAYFNEVEQTQKNHPDLIVVGGTESSVNYFWEGLPSFSLTQGVGPGTLLLRNYRVHMLALDLPSRSDYAKVPIPHSGYSLRYVQKQFWPFAAACGVCALVWFAWIGRCKRRWMRLAAIAPFLLGIVNYLPIDNCPFSTYRNPGVAPFQTWIDYVNEKGGIAVWAHPESQPNAHPEYEGMLESRPYLDLIEQCHGALAFPSIYGEKTTAERPGQMWDRMLMDYVAGKRDRPLWGFGEVDFNGTLKDPISFIRTMFYLKERSAQGVLEAFRAGRMYGFNAKGSIYLLMDFSLEDSTGRKMSMGSTVKRREGGNLLCIDGGFSDGRHDQITVRIIRNEELVREETRVAPIVNWRWEDTDAPEKCYYRIELTAPDGLRALSNPIFVIS